MESLIEMQFTTNIFKQNSHLITSTYQLNKRNLNIYLIPVKTGGKYGTIRSKWIEEE